MRGKLGSQRGHAKRKRTFGLVGVLLAALLAATSLTVASASAQPLDEFCEGNRKSSETDARQSFSNNCVPAFSSDTIKCGEVTDGWRCNNDIGASGSSNSEPANAPEAPASSESASPQSNGGFCEGNRKSSESDARQSFKNNCVPAFSANTIECGRVTDGWRCNNGNQNSSSDDSQPAAEAQPANDSRSQTIYAPTVRQVEYTPDFVRIVWNQNYGAADGIKVIRNAQLVGDIPTPGTVFNDYNGEPGDIYRLVAYRSGEAAVRGERINTIGPVSDFRVDPWDQERFENSVSLSWRTNNDRENIASWRIYRNGEPFATHEGPYTKDEVVDRDPEGVDFYGIQAVSNSSIFPNGPIMFIEGPEITQYRRELNTPRSTPSFQVGNSRATNRTAREANQAISEAADARAESDRAFDAVLDNFSGSVSTGVEAGVGTNGPSIGVDVGVEVETTGTLGDAFRDFREWREADGRADRLEDEAERAVRTHEHCMANGCEPPPRPDIGGGTDTDTETETDTDTDTDTDQVGGNEGATRGGNNGDGSR